MRNSSYIKPGFWGLLLLQWVCFPVVAKGKGGTSGDLSLFQNPEPYVSLEANYSRLLNRQVQFNGYGVGFDFDGSSLGLAYYRLSSNVFTPRYSSGADWKFRMNYISVQLSQRLYESGKFGVVAALGNGFGQINLLEGVVDKGRHGVYVFEPGIDASYTIVSWLALSTQLGYRLAFPGGPPTTGELSAPKFHIGFSVLPVPLYRAFKNKDFS